MQYLKPDGGFFVGDCMPFCHAGTFRLFYLLDENHHGALGGLGGHQWAQASSRDLVHWEHHPLAIGITEDREGSICTGSVFFHAGTYYGFYATRMRDKTQHLSLAKSRDGIHFEKTDPNPFASPPAGYDPFHYRDPVVFQDPGDGLFHMLATARLVNGCISDRGRVPCSSGLQRPAAVGRPRAICCPRPARGTRVSGLFLLEWLALFYVQQWRCHPLQNVAAAVRSLASAKSQHA